MPSFDLRHIRAAEYHADGTYTGAVVVGDAMNVNLELRFAEGRLYAEGCLAEMLREAIGGTASMGVKYIKSAAKTLLYGVVEKSRTIGQKTVKSELLTAKAEGKYVGFAFFAPDMVDGERKYTAALIYRAKFGYPSMTYQTKGESINFQTPNTTGEFLPAAGEDQELLEVVTLDTEAEAAAWVDAVVNYSE